RLLGATVTVETPDFHPGVDHVAERDWLFDSTMLAARDRCSYPGHGQERGPNQARNPDNETNARALVRAGTGKRRRAVWRWRWPRLVGHASDAAPPWRISQRIGGGA